MNKTTLNSQKEKHSMLSLRRATVLENVLAAVREFLSMFSLRRATLELKPISNFGLISIHALLAESDDGIRVSNAIEREFLSTLSLRRATAAEAHTMQVSCISIHALLAESDLRRGPSPLTHSNFYPRSPCGERRHF